MPLQRVHLILINLLLLFSVQWQLLTAAVMPQPLRQATSMDATVTAQLTDQLIIKFVPAATALGNQTGITATTTQAAVTTQLQTLRTVANIELAYYRPMSGDAHVLKLPEAVEPARAQAIAARLMANAADLGLAYVEPDYRRQAQLTPSDPYYGEQWHLQATTANNYSGNLAEAWNVTTGSSSVVVAVLDTGIRAEHPDLVGRTVAGYDFVSDATVANDGDARDNDPSDPGDWITASESRFGPFRGCGASDSSWHGTHVAGILGATGNNGVGIAGVAWQSPILPVRVLGKCGGSVSDIADALRWAAGLEVAGVPANLHPARVINLSLAGAGSCSNTEQNAINEVINQGVVVVVAAGNSNQNAANYSPGNCHGVINVAATNRAGSKAAFSNYGATVALSAPGGDSGSETSADILSTIDLGTQGPQAAGYGYYAGTSMAAPQVAGIAALILARNGALTAAQVQQLLQSSTTDFPVGSSCTPTNCGTGIVNALAALNAADNLVTTPTPALTATTVSATATPRPLFTPTTVPTLTPTATIDGSLPLSTTHYLPLIQGTGE